MSGSVNFSGSPKFPIVSDLENFQRLSVKATETDDKKALRVIGDRMNALNVPAKLTALNTTQELDSLIQASRELLQNIEEKTSLAETLSALDSIETILCVSDASDQQNQTGEYTLENINALWTLTKKYYSQSDAHTQITELEKLWRSSWDRDRSTLGRRQLIDQAHIFLTTIHRVFQNPKNMQILTEKMQYNIFQHLGKRPKLPGLEQLNTTLRKLPEDDEKRKTYQKKADFIQGLYEKGKINEESLKQISLCYEHELQMAQYTDVIFPLERLEQMFLGLKNFFDDTEDPFATLQMILTKLKTASGPFPELAAQIEAYQGKAEALLQCYEKNLIDEKRFEHVSRGRIQELNELVKNFIFLSR